MTPTKKQVTKIAGAIVAAALSAAPQANAASGTWNVDAGGNWSTGGNWTDSTVPGTTAGDVVGLNYDITTAGKTVAVDTAVRVGVLNIGDPNGTNSYTLTGTTGGSFAFDNGGSGAQLNQVSTTQNATINNSLTLLLDDNLTINNQSSGRLNLNGAITDGVNGAKTVTVSSSGSGEVYLTGTNTFSGGMIIDSGKVVINSAGNVFGAGAITMNGGSIAPSGATARTISNNITVAGTGAFGGDVAGKITLSGTVSGTGTLVKSGTNVVEVTGANSFTGGFSVNSGTLRLSNASASSVSNITQVNSGALLELNAAASVAGLNDNAGTGGTVSVSGASRVLTVGGTGSYSFNGVLQDSGANILSLTKSGAGTQALGGMNTYSGTTTISGGVLRLNSSGALSSSSALVLNGAVLGLTAGSGDFTRSIVGLTPGAGQVGWLASGSGGFAAFGGDRQVNFGGAGASVTWSSSGGVFGNNLILSDATSDSKVTVVNPIGFASGVRTITVNNGSAAVDAELAGVLSAGTLKKEGAGTLELTGSAALSQTVNAGILRVSSTNSNNSAAVTVAAGATLQVNADQSMRSLEGAGTVSAYGANRTYAVAGTGTANTYTFSGVLQDDGANKLAFTKSGGSTQVLNGVNTYTGNTTVNGGALALGASGSISNSPLVDVKAGATFSTTAKASFAMLSGQTFKFTLDPAGNAGAGSSGLLAAAGLDITNGVVDFATVGLLDDAAYVIASFSSLTGTQFATVYNLPTGYDLDYGYNGGTQIALVVVPEPSTFVMLVSGLGLLVGMQRARRRVR